MIWYGNPVRSFNANEYRYGFNGKEKDDEIKGNSNHLSFGDYGYDTRLGRRWQVDPLAREMASWSPYSVFFDNPIRYIDADGRKPGDPPTGGDKPKTQKTTSDKIIDFGKGLVEGFVDSVTFTASSILSGVGNTIVGVSKKIERVGFIQALDDGGIDVLSKEERFSSIGFSFENEGLFKKEEPNFSEKVSICIAPFNLYGDEADFSKCAYRIDYMVKSIHNAVETVQSKKMSGNAIKMPMSVMDEINKKTAIIKKKTLIVNRESVNTFGKKVINQKDFESNYTYKYKLVTSKEFKEILGSDNEEYVCLMPVSEVNKHILIYEPSTKETVYYGWAMQGLDVSKKDIKKIVETAK